MAQNKCIYNSSNTSGILQLMLAIITQEQSYKDAVESFLRSWMPGGSVPYTPGGLAHRNDWGALQYAGNFFVIYQNIIIFQQVFVGCLLKKSLLLGSAAFIAIVADKQGIMTGEARDWAKGQIDYILGSNPNERSYVVGFGDNPPLRPHHRAASVLTKVLLP